MYKKMNFVSHFFYANLLFYSLPCRPLTDKCFLGWSIRKRLNNCYGEEKRQFVSRYSGYSRFSAATDMILTRKAFYSSEYKSILKWKKKHWRRFIRKLWSHEKWGKKKTKSVRRLRFIFESEGRGGSQPTSPKNGRKRSNLSAWFSSLWNCFQTWKLGISFYGGRVTSENPKKSFIIHSA